MTNYFAKGNEYYNSKLWKQAIEFYKKDLEENGQYAPPLYNIGVCYIKLKEYDNAIYYLKEALKITEDPIYYFNLGYCYSVTMNYKESLINFNKAKRLDPYDEETEKAIDLILFTYPELSYIIKETERDDIINNIEIKDMAEEIEELKWEELNVSVLVEQTKLLRLIDNAIDSGNKDEFLRLSIELNELLDKDREEYLENV